VRPAFSLLLGTWDLRLGRRRLVSPVPQGQPRLLLDSARHQLVAVSTLAAARNDVAGLELSPRETGILALLRRLIAAGGRFHTWATEDCH